MESTSVERKETIIIRRANLINKNCEHVVDVNEAGDVFCTQCDWSIDPQELVKYLISVGRIDSAPVKEVLGWN